MTFKEMERLYKEHFSTGYLATDINKCLKQNNIASLTSHPSLIAYKGLKDTEFFKNIAPLIEDYYLIGCTFKNWMLNNLDTPDYNKIIGRKHYKIHWATPFPKALKKVLIQLKITKVLFGSIL